MSSAEPDENVPDDDSEQQMYNAKAIVDGFEGESLRRYEHFRRSHFEKKKVKELIQQALGPKASYEVLNHPNIDEFIISISGATKMHVGEIIEKAREIRSNNDADDDLKIVKKEVINGESTTLLSNSNLLRAPALNPLDIRKAVDEIKNENRRKRKSIFK